MKMKNLVLSSAVAVGALTFAGQASASAKEINVHKGDTLYGLGQRYDVSISSIKEANNRTSDMIYAGENLEIPGENVKAAAKETVKAASSQDLSYGDKDLLSRLVDAEAKGEPHEGKVAVASVILNRMESSKFPDTVKDVIYEKGQFSPVANGAINDAATKDAENAVEEALDKGADSDGPLYFYNPNGSGSGFMDGKVKVETIGNHVFAK
ncbi:cell wall hydrolase [Metabacillus sp. GX 13764]|uniref:cell wall hydrolase n=1 Tax=Metabacillus kandeliae TaxID=2900151 RepID=UPI001E34E717|nr:cell wall hydrolase [Metabacillus kandeliae]MCD7036518.1 cell wall hydrolase [Metabacillus kandeliae]